MKKAYSYLEWNLNQATNRNAVPDFVFEEIKHQDKDIVVLVEYCDTCGNSEKFKRKLESIGYKVKVNDKNNKISQNDVLIAWKESLFSLGNHVFTPPAEGDYPEMLAVKLKDKTDNTSFVVVGVRIRLLGNDEYAWRKRAAQLSQMLQSIYQQYSKDEVLVILGDFNNNRVDLEKCKEKPFVNLWSVKVIEEITSKYGLIRVTPSEGSSIRQEYGIVPFKEDHLLVSRKSNVKPGENDYSREFTERNKDIYIHGKDFAVYNSRIRETTWAIPYGTGIPDHALLIGTLVLE